MDTTTLPDSNVQTAADDSPAARIALFRKTYATLCCAILLFLVLEILFLRTRAIVHFMVAWSQGALWLAILASYILVTALSRGWAKASSNPVVQYTALLLYVAAEALLFVPIIYLAFAVTGDYSIFRSSALLCGCLFLSIVIIAVLFSESDFSLVGSASIAGGLIGLGFIVCQCLFGFTPGTWFPLVMIGVAVGSILHGTRTMHREYAADQHVAAALGLFGSFMLLVWHVINLRTRLTKS